MTTNKKLLDNGQVEITTVETINRYSGRAYYSQCACECIVDNFTDTNKIWTTKHSREGFEHLDTKEEWEPEGESVAADIESFQKYLDETYGKDKYEAYALGAYVHSNVSFAFNKGEDRRCPWDSGTAGFVGISKEMYDGVDLNSVASELSDAWNGYISILEVWDNYEDDVIDEICSTESVSEINKWKEMVKEQYGVTEFKELN